MTRPFTRVLVLTTCLGLAVALPGQSQERGMVPAPSGGSVPKAHPADVETLDGIITALYDVISGPAGQARDWDRFRSLHVPDARLIPTGFPPDGGPGRARLWSVEEYIEAAGPQLESGGFFEREIGRVEERFENIAHVFSTYDSRRTQDGDVFQRGINSIQLMWDGRRWWIFNIFWRGVGPEAEIPARYLKTSMPR